jgi:hypothetical protein
MGSSGARECKDYYLSLIIGNKTLGYIDLNLLQRTYHVFIIPKFLRRLGVDGYGLGVNSLGLLSDFGAGLGFLLN